MTSTPLMNRLTAVLLLLIITPWMCIFAVAQNAEKEFASGYESDSASVIKRVTGLYEAGSIAEAEHLALRALDNPEGLSRFDRFELYRILAFCAVANDDEQGGVRQFVAALRLNPSLSPDLITWSPKVRRVFLEAKKLFEEQVSKEILTRRIREADICRRASLKSLYFPGAGQFYKKSRQKGFVVSTLFWGAAAVLIYSQAVLPTVRDRYKDSSSREEAGERWREYRDIYRLRFISGGITVSVYAYAFFDALWKRPNVELEYVRP